MEPQQPARKRSFGPSKSNKRKSCPFSAGGQLEIDYKDVEMLKKFITDRGKILPRRITGVSARSQTHLSRAIKRARMMALLPFVDKN